MKISTLEKMSLFLTNHEDTKEKNEPKKIYWTKEEDEKLFELVHLRGLKKWTLIANHFKGRNGRKCRARYKNYLNPDTKKGEWTEEEDRIIIELQSKLGNKWSQISKSLPGRTSISIRNRWNSYLKHDNHKISKCLVENRDETEDLFLIESFLEPEFQNQHSSPPKDNPLTLDIKNHRTRWTREDDEKLVELVKLHGLKKWTMIAAHFKGRTSRNCRERYLNHLNPDTKKGEWTEEEDRLVIELHSKLGNKWSQISKFLPKRTPDMIKNRWNSYLRNMNNETKEFSIRSDLLAKKITKKQGKDESEIIFPPNEPYSQSNSQNISMLDTYQDLNNVLIEETSNLHNSLLDIP